MNSSNQRLFHFCDYGQKLVWMTAKEVAKLPAYNSSYPTGTTIGKRWKRTNGGITWICEYIEVKRPGYVAVRATRLMLVNHRPEHL